MSWLLSTAIVCCLSLKHPKKLSFLVLEKIDRVFFLKKIRLFLIDQLKHFCVCAEKYRLIENFFQIILQRTRSLRDIQISTDVSLSLIWRHTAAYDKRRHQQTHI